MRKIYKYLIEIILYSSIFHPYFQSTFSNMTFISLEIRAFPLQC